MTFEDSLMLIDNQRIKNYYKNRLINLALAQFEWDGLPDTCDRLYFEKQLLFTGKAAMLKPVGSDEWLSLGYVTIGNLSVYGYPTKIRGVGFNNANIETKEWEFLYDNMTKQSLLDAIDLYASLLAEILATFRCNVQKQNTPYIVTGSKYQELSFKNIFLKIFGHAPYLMLKKPEDKEAIDVLDLKVNFYGKDLMEVLKITWDEAISMLGIAPAGGLNDKKERLITDEVDMAREENVVCRNARLMNREQFCDKMKKHGVNLSVNMVTDLDARFVEFDHSVGHMQYNIDNTKDKTNYGRQ
ncbi:MAG: hypothetical protein J6S07_05420 [Bacteroidaceae bacterium]|nr:hypothetical protein [Bacteroidaceae bacterium]